ncbi:unnamed protein product [Polarella glacialis]|uniref:Hexose transporter 1 n=1 Tax=Polarella glacialis TaxID=89957 RepID=A0A813K484_POLGL|nr:unnamed protein product [Polarella glacialis]
MMIVALALLGTAFSFRYCSEAGVAIADCQSDSITLPRSWAILTVIALGVYVSGYQIGFGPISWLMISEIFPLGVRGSALSTAALVNFSSNILMTLCQTALMKALTPAGTFFAYLVLAVVSFVFVYYIVPETKGKSLEEIEDETWLQLRLFLILYLLVLLLFVVFLVILFLFSLNASKEMTGRKARNVSPTSVSLGL